jgi:predicted SnoaL-like aldol condensation-catalyzing enzyme
MKRVMTSAIVLTLLLVSGAQAAILIPSGKKDSAREEANRALVLDFWNNFFSGKTDQWAKWLSPDFVNHDPYEPSGGEAFANFVKGNAGGGSPPPAASGPTPAVGMQGEPPARSNDRLFLMADGDLVLIVYPGSNQQDLTEEVHGNIVRVYNGKITDWWLIGSFPGRAAKETKISPNNKQGVQPIVTAQ